MGDLKKTKTKRSEKHQLAASGEQNNRMYRSGTRDTRRNVYRWHIVTRTCRYPGMFSGSPMTGRQKDYNKEEGLHYIGVATSRGHVSTENRHSKRTVHPEDYNRTLHSSQTGATLQRGLHKDPDCSQKKWKRIKRLKWNSEEGSLVTQYDIYSAIKLSEASYEFSL